MAESVIKSGIKRYVFPKQTFTFPSGIYYYTVGNYSNVIARERIVGVYISSWDGNNGPLSVALGRASVYAIGNAGTTITGLEVTITYI